MKLCIVSEAIGFGHVMRDIELFRRLKKRGWKADFITYGESASYLKRKKYSVHSVRTSVDLKENPDGLDVSKTMIDNIRARHLGSIKRIADVLNRSKPDVVMVDTSILGVIAADLHMGFRSVPRVYVTSGNDLGAFGGDMLKRGIRIINKYVSKTSDVMLIPDIPLPSIYSFGIQP